MDLFVLARWFEHVELEILASCSSQFVPRQPTRSPKNPLQIELKLRLLGVEDILEIFVAEAIVR